MTSFYVTSFICSSVRARASFWTSALVIDKIVKVQILFVCMGQQRKFFKVIWAFDVIGQRSRCPLYYYIAGY
jgi:hypothetical protein